MCDRSQYESGPAVRSDSLLEQSDCGQRRYRKSRRMVGSAYERILRQNDSRNRQDHESDACLRVNCAISEAIELTALSVDRH